MDIFGGIGNWVRGLFGGKKDDDDDKKQPQQNTANNQAKFQTFDATKLTTSPQQSSKLNASPDQWSRMPKVLTEQGQQDWLRQDNMRIAPKRNQPSVQTPTFSLNTPSKQPQLGVNAPKPAQPSQSDQQLIKGISGYYVMSPEAQQQALAKQHVMQQAQQSNTKVEQLRKTLNETPYYLTARKDEATKNYTLAEQKMAQDLSRTDRLNELSKRGIIDDNLVKQFAAEGKDNQYQFDYGKNFGNSLGKITQNNQGRVGSLSLKDFVDQYNKLNGDEQADIRENLQKLALNYERKGDSVASNHASMLATIVSKDYGLVDEKGPSIGRQFVKNVSQGGFVGDAATAIRGAFQPGYEDDYQKRLRDIDVSNTGIFDTGSKIVGGMLAAPVDVSVGTIQRTLSANTQDDVTKAQQYIEAYNNKQMSLDDLHQAIAYLPSNNSVQTGFVYDDKTGQLRKRNVLESTANFAGKVIDTGTTLSPYAYAKAAEAPAMANNALKATKAAETAEQVSKISKLTRLNPAQATLAADAASGTLQLVSQPMQGREIRPEDVVMTVGGTLLGNVSGIAGDHAVRTVSDNTPRTVYRGGAEGDVPSFVTQNSNFANEFAADRANEGLDATLSTYKLKPKDVLDISRPDHLNQVAQILDEAQLSELSSKTPSGVFSPEDEAKARAIAQQLGYKGVKFDERQTGLNTPEILTRQPYSIGVVDESALRQTGQTPVRTDAADLPGVSAAADDSASTTLGRQAQDTPAQPEASTQAQVSPYTDSNTEVSRTVENGQPHTVVKQKMADGSELVTKTSETTGVQTTDRVVPEDARQSGVVGASDVAEGYFDPTNPAAGLEKHIDELTPSQQRAVRRAIDEVIYEQNPELVNRAMYSDPEMMPGLTEDGGMNGAIPRLHTEDLRHYLGNQSEGIPSYYKRRNGPRDIDRHAMGNFDGDVDAYLEAWLGRIEGRATDKQMAAELRELKKNPEILQQAEALVRKRITEAQADIANTRELRRQFLQEGDLESVRDADAHIAELEKSMGMKRTKPPKITNIDVKVPRGKNMTEYVAVTSDGPTGSSITELVPLDGEMHRVQDGTVVDKKGRSVGSYVAIDEDGNQYAYVEGKPVNITGILGNIDAWGNVNKAYMDMDRNIELNAPDATTARKVQQFTTVFKDRQEAAMKTDLKQKRGVLYELEKKLDSTLPQGIKKDEFSADLFRMMESKVDMAEMRAKYGDAFFEEQIKPTLTWARAFLDDILDKTNRSLEKNGYDPIPRRDNYMTHIQEDPSFWEKVGIGVQDLNPFGSSISSDINPGKVRGGTPDEIVGNTADTGARKRWNPFAQTRRGSAHKQDFFAAMDAYVEPMLFNQYMTPAASRARVIEKAFRTYEKAKEIKLNELAEIVGMDEARKLQPTVPAHKNYKADRSSPLITAWQEYGNMLAGKTNAIDRVILDKTGDAGKKILGISTKMQGIAGANTIPGSTTAALAQILSVPQTIARDSAKSTLKAARDMLSRKNGTADDPMMKSSFMRARYTDATSRRKSAARKYTDAASTPMNAIERATGEFSWRSAYEEALSQGYTGDAAMTRADVETKKTLAGRGIGDRPMIMNSKALGPVTQFSLEVGNMGVQFWRDFTPAQKAKFMVAAAALNTIYGALTGQTPLPDYIKASLDTIGDMTSGEDDEDDTVLDNLKQGGQRMLGETAKFIPGAPILASMLMDDQTKEAVFGKDSDVGRYGDPAISRIPKAVVEGVTGLVTGDLKKVRDSTLSVIPTGNQIKRTVQGAEALNNGYVTTQSGQVRNPVDSSNPLNWAQGLVFGQYSLPDSQASLANGQYLSKDQSEVFKTVNEKDPAAAREFFDSVMGKRNSNPSDMSQSAASLVNDANMQKKLKDGTWKEVDGEIVDKNGDVQRAYYKEAAKALPEGSEEAYKAYLKGYDLETGTKYDKGRNADTGDKELDRLIGIDAKNKASSTSASGKAISLFSDSSTYKNVPDWVKDRFYQDAGFTKEEVAYGAYAKLDSDTRLNEIYRPIAENQPREQLVQSLIEGRRQSIYNKYMMAQDNIVTELYKEGYLTYEEQRYIKGLKFDRAGKQISTKNSSSRGGKVKGLVADYNITLPKLSSPWDFGKAPEVSLGDSAATKNVIKGIKGPNPINVKQEALPTPRVA